MAFVGKVEEDEQEDASELKFPKGEQLVSSAQRRARGQQGSACGRV